MKGPGSGRDTAIRSLQAAGLETGEIRDVTPAGPQRLPPAQAEARLMARETGSACKLCRREGEKLFLKGERCLTDKCGIERRNYPPGDHGRGRSRQSEYRVQLREKQKATPLLRRAREAVPPRTTRKASRAGGVTGENLLRLLETRFDNVLVRLGFAASRRQARQLIKHGHWQVNGAPGRHSLVPGAHRRRDHRQARVVGRPEDPRGDRARLRGSGLAPGRPRRSDGEGSPSPRARRDRRSGAGAADRRAVLEVSSPSRGGCLPRPRAHQREGHT